MDELKSHIFIRHPDRKIATCWGCSAKKEQHEFHVHYPPQKLVVTKTRKKATARAVRTRSGRVRAVR